MTDSISKALQSLEGLSVGDAFGELFFSISPYTTCAIVGGIVALSSPEIPPLWLKRREQVKLTTK